MSLFNSQKTKTKILTEAQEQIEIIRWWRQECCLGFQFWQNALFHIPNGGGRHIVEASRLKKEGVVSGVPDLFLAIPRGQYHGLWVELKRVKGGSIKPEQKEFIAFLRAQGFCAYVCKGALAAKQLIYNYLSSPDNLIITELIYKGGLNGSNSTDSSTQMQNFKLPA